MPETPPLCCECGNADTQLVKGAVIYPHRPDLQHKNLWLCRCGAYVGCHAGTEKALGFCGNAETRKARRAAHAAFDPIWKERLLPRHEAYHRLADRMGIERGNCHIAQMDSADAWQAHYEAHHLYETLLAERYRATP